MTAIILAVAFIGGVPLIPLLATGTLGAVAAVGFVFSSDRRYDRFTAFLDMAGHKDRLSYQTWQGLLAMADGGLTGSGIGAGNGKMGYLPLAHSDFIFAVVGDELGFVGVVAVLGGFGLLVWFGIQAALSSPDRFGMLLAGGITAWFGVQAIINTGGVSGLMPVTGPDPAVLLGRRFVAVHLDDRRRLAAQRRPARPAGADRKDRDWTGATGKRRRRRREYVMVFAVITGGGTAGHVLPALAIAEALQDAGHPATSIYYIGAQRGIETELVPTIAVPAHVSRRRRVPAVAVRGGTWASPRSWCGRPARR